MLRTGDALEDLQQSTTKPKSDRVRRSALGALAMIADPASRVLFQNGLTDKSDGIRASAAEGFARLKNPANRPTIEKAFNEEKKMGPRLADAFALVAMGNLQTTELAPLTYLVNTLNSKGYRDVALPYVMELAREAAVRPVLYGYLKTGTRDEKVGLARALAVSGDRSSVGPLQSLTKDPDSAVAEEAIRALRTLQARLG